MRRVKEEKKRSERTREKKDDAGVRNGSKAATQSVFPMICGSGGPKSRLAKAAGAEAGGQMRDKNCTPLWRKHISKSKCTKHVSFGPLLKVQMSEKCTPLGREAHFQGKMHKTHQVRTTFSS